MPSYEEMLEYVLDMGKECECCPMATLGCHGITHGPNGPIFPKCSDMDMKDLLQQDWVERVYEEDHADA